MRSYLLLLLLLPGWLSAQALRLVPFGPDEGLPPVRVDAVAATDTGYVYARAAGEWYRYDGDRFAPAA